MFYFLKLKMKIIKLYIFLLPMKAVVFEDFITSCYFIKLIHIVLVLVVLRISIIFTLCNNSLFGF